MVAEKVRKVKEDFQVEKLGQLLTLMDHGFYRLAKRPVFGVKGEMGPKQSDGQALGYINYKQQQNINRERSIKSIGGSMVAIVREKRRLKNAGR